MVGGGAKSNLDDPSKRISNRGLLAVFEALAQHDEDVAMLMHDFKIHQFIAGLGTFSTALLFTSLGVPMEDATQTVQETMASGGGVVNPEAVEATKVVVQTYAGNANPTKLETATVAGSVE